MSCASDNLVLVTGATGYVGGRLVPRLLHEGCRVRVLVRDPAKLTGLPWRDRVEVFRGDPLKPPTLPDALNGVASAYYLIHSMTAGSEFRRRDITAAHQFGRAAREAGTQRIIYLGGLGNPETDLSEHLRSRQETGEALRESGVPVTEFRAAIVVGAGSISFEMIRYLAERVPLMICPRWVYTRVQPIAIEDVLHYLVASLSQCEAESRVVEIGGADVLTYGEMMTRYATVRGLRRWLIPVPVLTPRLSSYWVHWVTPIRAAYARPLIEGLRNEVVVRDDRAATLFPAIRPMGYEQAVRTALGELNAARCAARLEGRGEPTKPLEVFSLDGMIVERRRVEVEAPARELYRVFSHLGGRHGWPAFQWAWRLRALFDHMIGGVGLRRTRPDREDLRAGDAVDFYRVETVVPGRLVRLRVELKLPGEGWVQFEAEPRDSQRSRLVQTVFFSPCGLGGVLYWYLFYPAHAIIFNRMLAKMAGKAESARAAGTSQAQAAAPSK